MSTPSVPSPAAGNRPLGISGHLAARFIHSPLTPLLLLASLALGLLALNALPREEEPQISVPMVDIHVVADGLRAVDAIELITKPLEDIVQSIDGVDHVYAQTTDDRVLVTARFEVGTDEDVAILRVHETVRAEYDRIPLGIPEPLIIGHGINDVPIMVLTLFGEDGATLDRWSDGALFRLADTLLPELRKVPDVGATFMVGGRADELRVEPDPERLSLYGVTLNDLVETVEQANRSFLVGRLRNGGQALPLAAGQTLQGLGDLGNLVIAASDGRPVYLKDVADITLGGQNTDARLWHAIPIHAAEDANIHSDEYLSVRPAVSIALAKRKDANAVVVADAVLERLSQLQGDLIPEGVRVEITRNQGETAAEKADELTLHLILATISIVVLIGMAVGRREAIVVAVVIPTTILLTLFASWMLGYTINRVSLFALIFSIGILVDDAIVVVENIARHWRMADSRSRLQKAIDGVAEVGNPTIIATLTIIAALLPMLFVSGLMGPYMSPIPVNAGAAMVFSFFVAVMLTPWMMLKLSPRPLPADRELNKQEQDHDHGVLAGLYLRIAAPLLASRRRAWIFLGIVGLATLIACLPFYTQHVTVKLLPFDDKSELQVVVDLPNGAALEETERVLFAAARRLATMPSVHSMQLHAGTAAPFTFNGLVRHSFLRQSPHLGDIQVNLTPKAERDQTGHEIALAVRAQLSDLPMPNGTRLKIVELPPGPPVLATLLAEVYGPTTEARRAGAARIEAAFRSIPYIVDIDVPSGPPSERLRYAVDRQALEYHGVDEEAVFDTLAALVGGVSIGYSHRGGGEDPIEITLRQPIERLVNASALMSTPVPGANGFVELGELVRHSTEAASPIQFRRDGRDMEMVTAELAGRFEAPIYGMFAVEAALADQDWSALGGRPPTISYAGQPVSEQSLTLLWDGEWEITYVTFRDMGAAFAAAILGIYLLVVGQFGSFRLPLVILIPVPLTLIGIVLGHWLFNAPFTATSMIGFIALAGIIVRNSILLVDFIRHLQAAPTPLPIRDIVLEAGAIRFKPIALTAAAAVIGSAFILTDPIFQGLAISLVFGLAGSTALTVLVIPAVYVALRR